MRFTFSTFFSSVVSTRSTSWSSDSGDGACPSGDSPLMKTASSDSDSGDGGVGVCPSGDISPASLP